MAASAAQKPSLVGNDIERPLPHHPEAERCVLGAIIVDNDAYPIVRKSLQPGHFFLTTTRTCYQAMIRLAEKQRQINTVTLMEELEAAKELDAAGGILSVSQLADGLPRVSAVASYAEIILNLAVRRELIYLGQKIYEAGFEGADCEETVVWSQASLEKIREQGLASTRNWREKFHTVSQLPVGETIFLIDQILPEGITFVGAHSGVGKTWFSLSMARALTTGRPFLSQWKVPEPTNVLYLCPEMSGKTFRKRAESMGIGERFYCQTIADGAALDLDALLLVAAIRELKPVIFLDTAIRFSNAKDENSALDNRMLVNSLFSLIRAGALAVVCLHHRSSAAARAEEMTLENTFRGTTDFGAIADAVYGIRYDQLSGGNAAYLKESRKLVRLQVRCVKARDFVPVDDFRVQLVPSLNEAGDMALLGDAPEGPYETDADRVAAYVAGHEKASLRSIATATGVSKDRVKRLAKHKGWSQDEEGVWECSQ